MARRDLTNEEIEAMGREVPGSADEYLRLRREELAEEERQRREEEDKEMFVEAFTEAGGDKKAAEEAYQRKVNEEAE
jgi:hypothetical protein